MSPMEEHERFFGAVQGEAKQEEDESQRQKRRRTNTTASMQQKGKGNGKGKNAGRAVGRRASHNGHDQENDLTLLMARLLIRHEYSLNSMRVDTTFHLFLKSGAGSPIGLLFRDAQKWKRIKEDRPQDLQQSLRECLLRSLLAEFKTRLQNFQAQEKTGQFAKEQGWTNQEGLWTYGRWNPEEEQVQIQTQVPPRSTETVLADIQVLQEHMGNTHPQILFDQKVNGEPGVSMDRVPAGGFLAGRRNQGVGDPASVDWPSGLASVGCQTSTGAPRTKRSCPDATELAVAEPSRTAGGPDAELPTTLKCILRAALHNPGNHCYMNHTVLCMLWCHEQLELADIHTSPLLVALLNSLRVHPILSLMPTYALDMFGPSMEGTKSTA